MLYMSTRHLRQSVRGFMSNEQSRAHHLNCFQDTISFGAFRKMIGHETVLKTDHPHGHPADRRDVLYPCVFACMLRILLLFVVADGRLHPWSRWEIASMVAVGDCIHWSSEHNGVVDLNVRHYGTAQL